MGKEWGAPAGKHAASGSAHLLGVRVPHAKSVHEVAQLVHHRLQQRPFLCQLCPELRCSGRLLLLLLLSWLACAAKHSILVCIDPVTCVRACLVSGG